jgi:hypothetical protein
VGQSAVAVDLAKIYLWDRRPDKALAAINSSRQPGLPKDLMLERRLLEAAAYRDIGRFDHAIELVEPLDGLEAKSLLADSYWRSRQWPEAAKTLISMLPGAPAPTKPAAKGAQAEPALLAPAQTPADLAAIALRAAIAARMAKDDALLADIRRKYLPLVDNSSDKASFDLITAQTDITGTAIAEAVKRLADAPSVDAFAVSMKARFESDRKILADQATKVQAAKDAAVKEAAARAQAVKDAAAAIAAQKVADEKAAQRDTKKGEKKGGKEGGKEGEGKAAEAESKPKKKEG